MTSALEKALTHYIDSNGGGDGLFETPIDGLALMRSTREILPHQMLYRAALCIVVQGGKQMVLGNRTFDYADMQALVVSVQIPAFGRISKASVEKPFLGINLDLDVAIMRQVMEEMANPPKPTGNDGLGVFVQSFDEPLEDCVLRLVRLLDKPEAVPILYPSIMREVCYWLLTGRNGGEICKLASSASNMRRVADAIHVLRENYTKSIRVEELASVARMSPSSFHQHFKVLTAMTPLQYQKSLRLIEARRLLVSAQINVEGAAYQVGYESPSQFSREYTRMFGSSPKRDTSETGLASHRTADPSTADVKSDHERGPAFDRNAIVSAL